MTKVITGKDNDKGCNKDKDNDKGCNKGHVKSNDKCSLQPQ